MKKIKHNLLRVLAAALCLMLMLTACGGDPSANNTSQPGNNTNQPGVNEPAGNGNNSGGTIMWMAHMNSGGGYVRFRNYLEALCDAMGYKLTVVYGDSSNSASGNLDAVRNGMTDDVVGLVASMDGGIDAIMQEYPNLYVVGMASDMRSVYGEGGENAACLNNDHFLGAIAEGYVNGADSGELYAQKVIDGGYKKIKIIKFPIYAYPTQTEAEETLLDRIEEYNATAAQPIEVVGDTITLQFSTLPDSFFLEKENEGIDCIVALCSGTSFVYPTVLTAKLNGACDSNLKVITVGFNEDPSIAADTGDDGTLASIYSVNMETLAAYSALMLDNAIRGEQYADFEPKAVDAGLYSVDTQARVQELINIIDNAGNKDFSNGPMPVDVALSLSTRNNPNATQAELIEKVHELNAK